MKDNLFIYDIDPIDNFYRLIRDSSRQEIINYKLYLIDLWNTYEKYSDSDFRLKLSEDFDSRFWEMYLTCTLINNGKPIQPRETRTSGPDIFIKESTQAIFIEAVAPSVGDDSNPDKVPEMKHMVASRVPDTEMTMRYTGCIIDKYKKYEYYLDNNILEPTDAYIIAINSCKIKQSIVDQGATSDYPLVIKSILPIGYKAIRKSDILNKKSGEDVPWHYQPRNVVYRSSGTPVNTNILLDTNFSGLSGIIYTKVDIANKPSKMGENFIFIHNPNAVNKISQGYFNFGKEYTVELHT